jgi:hypothetical protein
MQAKTADPTEFLGADMDYAKAIDECIKEMKAMRVDMKKLDDRFERAYASSQKKLAQTRAILRDVEKTL